MTPPWLYNYPLWVTVLLFIVSLMIGMEFGFRMGRWWQRATPDIEKTGVGDIALNAMLALLGLVLAFTYSYTISRADQRKQAVVADANAIGTAFLRAEFASEPNRTALRRDLLKYAKSRTTESGKVFTRETLQKQIEESAGLLAALWPHAVRIVEADGNGAIQASIVQALNDVIDTHTIRVNAIYDLLPQVVIFMLIFIGGASLAVAGYNRGLAGSMNRFRMTALVLVLASVMTAITDFDRGHDGFIRNNKQSLVVVIQEMEATLAAEGPPAS